MKKKFFYHLTAFLLLIVFTVSCTSYKAEPLIALPIEERPHQVAAAAKAFNKQESKRYLDYNFLNKGFQPIQIYLKNNTDNTYVFSPDDLLVPTVDIDTITDWASSLTALKTGVAAFLAFPLCIYGLIAGVATSSGEIFYGSLAAAVLVPVGVSSNSISANKERGNDYMAKHLKKTILSPGKVLNGLIFVLLKNSPPSIFIDLVDVKNNAVERLNVKVQPASEKRPQL